MSSSKPGPPEVSIEDIRNAAISRRGGIRVRGGRLPPIRIRNLPQIGNAKKTVAPNIPQRRVKVKEEILDSSGFGKPRQVETNGQRDSRERGRGRGNKLIVQTEGTFLGQGPAARVKKELLDADYGRVSVPRSSKSSSKQGIAEFESKLDDKEIKYLLEPWDESEEALADCGEVRPVTLPVPKSEFKCKIKKEPCDEVEVKKEVQYKEIKGEPGVDKWHVLEGKFFAPIAYDGPKKANLIDLMDSTKISGDGVLLLFQMPQCLPFGRTECPLKAQQTATSKTSSSEAKDNEKEEVQDIKPNASFDGISNGCIGKLQVLKSGKMRLRIGSFLFTVEIGSDSESLMETVSICTQGENGGHITVLGKIERKIIVRPSDGLLNVRLNTDEDCS